MADYTYTKDPVNIDKLEQEIADEAFAVATLGSMVDGDQLTVSFDGSLTAGEEATLNAVVVNHAAPAVVAAPDYLCIKDGIDEPSGMVGCGALYVEGGALKFKFDSGNIVTLALDA